MISSTSCRHLWTKERRSKGTCYTLFANKSLHSPLSLVTDPIAITSARFPSCLFCRVFRYSVSSQTYRYSPSSHLIRNSRTPSFTTLQICDVQGVVKTSKSHRLRKIVHLASRDPFPVCLLFLTPRLQQARKIATLCSFEMRRPISPPRQPFPNPVSVPLSLVYRRAFMPAAPVCCSLLFP